MIRQLLVSTVCATLVLAQPIHAQQQPRARELGIPLLGTPGPFNAITDVRGVEVGHTTLISGSGSLSVGRGPVRTGVTAVLSRGRSGPDSAFAAWFSLNGNGEMTGTAWVDEGGILETPILITNTHSVGTVRDAAIEWMLQNGRRFSWTLPVVAETWDGVLNDINGFHVRKEHVLAALNNARAGEVQQGSVGGGTGMICNGFKGGIGTSSRVVQANPLSYTVGVLVQCNYGSRRTLRIAGVPLSADMLSDTLANDDAGSIIIVVATDAPLVPHQLERLVKRASLGIGRMGGLAANGSGDIFIAFSTANRTAVAQRANVASLEMLPNDRITPFFEATVQATEEAIINAMLAAEDMTGINDVKVPALPEEKVRTLMQRYYSR